MNSELAGRINSEYRINDKHFTNTNLGAFVDKSVEVYLRTCIMEVQGEAAAKNTQINLERWDGWVNEMKSYEYNPAHFHPHCQISTIFFFGIPILPPLANVIANTLLFPIIYNSFYIFYNICFTFPTI